MSSDFAFHMYRPKITMTMFAIHRSAASFFEVATAVAAAILGCLILWVFVDHALGSRPPRLLPALTIPGSSLQLPAPPDRIDRPSKIPESWTGTMQTIVSMAASVIGLQIVTIALRIYQGRQIILDRSLASKLATATAELEALRTEHEDHVKFTAMLDAARIKEWEHVRRNHLQRIEATTNSLEFEREIVMHLKTENEELRSRIKAVAKETSETQKALIEKIPDSNAKPAEPSLLNSEPT